MGRKAIDITDQKFGRWTVIEKAERLPNASFLWKCKCECGTERLVEGSRLRSGSSKSCGCLNVESHTKHHCSSRNLTRLYRIWLNMRRRCNNPKGDIHKRYFYRGIKVCEEWNSFENFQRWAYSAGYNDELTIDRIDNDGNYEPSNCKWASYHDQFRNTSQNIYLTYNGRTQIMKDWANEFGVKYETFLSRFHKGWGVEECIHGRPRKCKIFLSFNGKTQSIKQWADELGVDFEMLRSRKRRGWSDEEIITGERKEA